MNNIIIKGKKTTAAIFHLLYGKRRLFHRIYANGSILTHHLSSCSGAPSGLWLGIGFWLMPNHWSYWVSVSIFLLFQYSPLPIYTCI